MDTNISDGRDGTKFRETSSSDRIAMKRLTDVVHNLLARVNVALDSLEEHHIRQMMDMEEERIETSGRQPCADRLFDSILAVRGISNEMTSLVARAGKFLDKLLARCQTARSGKTFWSVGGGGAPGLVEASPEDREWVGPDPLELAGPTRAEGASAEDEDSITSSILAECTASEGRVAAGEGEGEGEGSDGEGASCDLPLRKMSRHAAPQELEFPVRTPPLAYRSRLDGIAEETPSALDVIRSCIEETCRRAECEMRAIEAEAAASSSDHREARDAELEYERLLLQQEEEEQQEGRGRPAPAAETPGDCSLSPSFLGLFAESEASSDETVTSTESSLNTEDEGRPSSVAKSAVLVLKKRLAAHGFKASFRLTPPRPGAASPLHVCHCAVDGLDVSTTGCARSKKCARNEAAAKMLELLSQKADDKTLPHGLTTFTPQELDEVSALAGPTRELHSSTGRLRCLCAELQRDPPKYSSLARAEGATTFIVHCQALGFNAVGSANKKNKAKRIASKKILSQYNLSLENTS